MQQPVFESLWVKQTGGARSPESLQKLALHPSMCLTEAQVKD